MIRRDLTITNRLGLHARATAKLVQLLSTFHCQATLEARGREVNAKSIMGVMLLAAGPGSNPGSRPQPRHQTLTPPRNTTQSLTASESRRK